MRDERTPIPPPQFVVANRATQVPTNEAANGLRWRSTDLAHHFISAPSTFYLFQGKIEHSLGPEIRALAIMWPPPTHHTASTVKVFAPLLAKNRPKTGPIAAKITRV